VDADINKDTYQQKVVENPLPTVVDFWGPQCARCLELTPALIFYRGGKEIDRMSGDEITESDLRAAVDKPLLGVGAI